MKSIFILNTAIETMLSSRFDVPKLVNSVQSALNESNLLREEAKRGNVKLTAKGKEYAVSETNRLDYDGKTTAPIQFASWHDAMARVFKVHGDPNDIMTITVLPASLLFWLEAKFVRQTEAKPQDNATKGKGKGQRNGNVESVPTPGAPA